MKLHAMSRLVQAAPVDEQKFYKALLKQLQGTGMVVKADIYRRARGLALGIQFKPKAKVDQVMKKVGWARDAQGSYSRNGEWPLFVGQAGPDAYAIQLVNAGNDQSMRLIGDRIKKDLKSFDYKPYDTNAIFTAGAQLFDLADLLDELKNFLTKHHFEIGFNAFDYVSRSENLRCEVKFQTPASGAVVLHLNFSTLEPGSI